MRGEAGRGQALIEAVGWRQSWLWLGLATWILLLPPIVLLLHDRPEDVGLHPDGDSEATGDGAATLEGVSLAEALRTPAFYVIAVTLSSHSLLLTALHLENTGILSAHGLDRQDNTSYSANCEPIARTRKHNEGTSTPRCPLYASQSFLYPLLQSRPSDSRD